MDGYDELRFAGRIDAALKTIKAVLENTRNPQVPADVPHRYDDKIRARGIHRGHDHRVALRVPRSHRIDA